ncbi:hypothetical protein [Altericroceibacterium xinjiangense]|uniref:hypothetical protein n=1 Tax=Altericroceibacterium xinjiangense TaxID=762261 RepID=UPI0019D2C34B|nr:hypothetical protein [Altericroceibacterium xinjiangense]
MIGGGWASLIWLAGALVLGVAAMRQQRVNARKLIMYAVLWTVLFAIVAYVFDQTAR